MEGLVSQHKRHDRLLCVQEVSVKKMFLLIFVFKKFAAGFTMGYYCCFFQCLVVPAFKGRGTIDVPSTKKSLMKLVKRKKVLGFA